MADVQIGEATLLKIKVLSDKIGDNQYFLAEKLFALLI